MATEIGRSLWWGRETTTWHVLWDSIDKEQGGGVRTLCGRAIRQTVAVQMIPHPSKPENAILCVDCLRELNG